MTLTTHGIVGAAVARVFAWHPVSAFFVAFLSHYIIDVLPHWDYDLKSARHDGNNHLNNDIVLNRDFVFDFIKIAFDAFFGLFLSFMVFQPAGNYQIFIIAFGVIGGVFPDFLQFAYFKFRCQPFILLQKFHHWCHTDILLTGRWISGTVLQIFFIIGSVALSWFFVS